MVHAIKVGKYSHTVSHNFKLFQILFLKLYMQKSFLNSVCYIFNIFQTPYICHLLYLLTRKEDVRLYRVRKLLELQTKLVIIFIVDLSTISKKINRNDFHYFHVSISLTKKLDNQCKQFIFRLL